MILRTGRTVSADLWPGQMTQLPWPPQNRSGRGDEFRRGVVRTVRPHCQPQAARPRYLAHGGLAGTNGQKVTVSQAITAQ